MPTLAPTFAQVPTSSPTPRLSDSSKSQVIVEKSSDKKVESVSNVSDGMPINNICFDSEENKKLIIEIKTYLEKDLDMQFRDEWVSKGLVYELDLSSTNQKYKKFYFAFTPLGKLYAFVKNDNQSSIVLFDKLDDLNYNVDNFNFSSSNDGQYVYIWTVNNGYTESKIFDIKLEENKMVLISKEIKEEHGLQGDQ